MKKSILKIIIFTTLIFTCSFILVACDSKLDRELQEMEEAHNIMRDFAGDLGIDIPEFGDTSGSVTEAPEEQPSNEHGYKSGYTLFPTEIFLNAKTNNRHTGQQYYVHAMPYETDIHVIGNSEYDLFYLVMFREDEDIEDVMELLTLSIIGIDLHESWGEITFTDEYIFYFEYIGYDDAKGQHIGKHISHELWDPWA